MPLKELLPKDRAMYGFETVADEQQLSHHQPGRYPDVADQALDAAFDRAVKGDSEYQKHHTPEMLAKSRGGNFRGPDLREGKSISWPIKLHSRGVCQSPACLLRAGIASPCAVFMPSILDRAALFGGRKTGARASSEPLLYLIGLVEATSKPRDLVYDAWIQEGYMRELKPNDATLTRAKIGAKDGVSRMWAETSPKMVTPASRTAVSTYSASIRMRHSMF